MKMTDPDRCVFCHGANGGRLGEEILLAGALLCKHCHEIHAELVQLERSTEVRPLDDESAAEIGGMAKKVYATAAEHLRQEEAGERVSLLTPVDVVNRDPRRITETVTDPDEKAMYLEMIKQNVVVCPECYNTGWLDDQVKMCPCPVGVFLGKKLRAGEL